VNPETSAPYPGTLGMEKEKPFNCETCGKRYKNLNGLKYVSRGCLTRARVSPANKHLSTNRTRCLATPTSNFTPWPRVSTSRPSPTSICDNKEALRKASR